MDVLFDLGWLVRSGVPQCIDLGIELVSLPQNVSQLKVESFVSQVLLIEAIVSHRAPIWVNGPHLLQHLLDLSA